MVQTSSYLCSDTPVFYSFRYLLESVALYFWQIKVKHVPVGGGSWTLYQGTHF